MKLTTAMTAQAAAYFRAVAIDYDGTLADGQVKPGRSRRRRDCNLRRRGGSTTLG